VMVFYPQKKLWGTKKQKTSLICSRSTNEFQMSQTTNEPLTESTNTARENSFPVNSLASGIIVLRDYVTIYKQSHPKLPKKKNRDQFCPTFMPGNYSQASTVAPSIRWRVQFHQTG
jgi:hypothetical protein